MANISRPQMLEGQSTYRPPLFTGSDYGYWKTRLTLYIKAQDYHVWRVIANGPHIPTKTNVIIFQHDTINLGFHFITRGSLTLYGFI